jgi:hypothetical protein
MDDISQYYWNGECWRWRTPVTFWNSIFGGQFEVYIHGSPDTPDESHATNAKEIGRRYRAILSQAMQFASDRYRSMEPVRGDSGNTIRSPAWDTLWIGFGTPGDNDTAAQFHVALELFDDTYGLWKVWFERNYLDAWCPCRLTRENW